MKEYDVVKVLATRVFEVAHINLRGGYGSSENLSRPPTRTVDEKGPFTYSEATRIVRERNYSHV